jgi:hypothetical protein
MNSRSRRMNKDSTRASFLTYENKRFKKAIAGNQGDEGYNRSSLCSHHSLLSAIYEPSITLS